MVNGSDAPRDADPQEDVHRVTSGHVPHARVGVLVLAGSHLARERVCNKITCSDFLRSNVTLARLSSRLFVPPVFLFVVRSIDFFPRHRPILNPRRYLLFHLVGATRASIPDFEFNIYIRERIPKARISVARG